MAETKELIAEIDTDNVGFVLDRWHWWQVGNAAEQILTLQSERLSLWISTMRLTASRKENCPRQRE